MSGHVGSGLRYKCSRGDVTPPSGCQIELNRTEAGHLWDGFDACVSDATGRKIRASDVDGMFEVDGRLLVIEMKGPVNSEAAQGQHKALKALAAASDKITVMIVTRMHDPDRVHGFVFGNGDNRRTVTVSNLMDAIHRWAQGEDRPRLQREAA